MRAGLGCADVGPFVSYPWASASSMAGDAAAREVAYGGHEVAIFATFVEKSRFPHPRARCVCMGMGRTGIGPCPTHPRARAGSAVGGCAAWQVACGGREVVIFAICAQCVWCMV